MIIIIDNYDSFTQNLAQYIGTLNFNIKVIRNDEFKEQNLKDLNPSHIIISPGPGKPQESEICLNIIKNYSNKIPILGVCLGHQSIGYVYGGKIKKLKKPMHGKISQIVHNQEDIFIKLPNPLNVTRYHSLIIDENNIPNNLKITAWTKEGTIMACKHKKYKKLYGLQFHPESLWTHKGSQIIENFLLN